MPQNNDAHGWIACDDGLHLIQMDKNLSHYGWVFRKVDGGLPYSVREATSHEMAHAQARQHLRIGVAQIAGQAPAPQPHPEPIAWMVGTAFWWTKEEAERDASETGLPIAGLGPMTGTAPAEEHQGEPVALPDRKLHVHQGLSHTDAKADGWNACLDEIAKLGPLYTHADPGEVERLRASEDKWYQDSVNLTVERDALRAQLAEAQALLREAACHATRMEPMSASCLNRIDTALDRKG